MKVFKNQEKIIAPLQHLKTMPPLDLTSGSPLVTYFLIFGLPKTPHCTLTK